MSSETEFYELENHNDVSLRWIISLNFACQVNYVLGRAMKIDK